MMDVDVQSVCASNPERCYFGNAPSLAEVKIAFSSEVCCAWITRHIQSVIATLGDKDNVPAEIIAAISFDILANYPWLTASEFMLFCSRCRVGKYGKLAYGNVTVDDITSNIPKFLSERSKEIEMYTRRRENEERVREYEERKSKCVSHDVALQIINKAADGDEEARKMLNNDSSLWKYRVFPIKWGKVTKENKAKIEEYFGVKVNIITNKPTAYVEQSKYDKFVEGIKRGYYSVSE